MMKKNIVVCLAMVSATLIMATEDYFIPEDGEEGYKLSLVNQSSTSVNGYVTIRALGTKVLRFNFSLDPEKSTSVSTYRMLDFETNDKKKRFGLGVATLDIGFGQSCFDTLHAVYKGREFIYNFGGGCQSYQIQLLPNNSSLRLRFKNGGSWQTQEWTQVKKI